MKTKVTDHKIVAREDWLAARRALLLKEKELSRQRDRLNEERRALPWVKVEKAYRFDGPDGVETLSDLFGGNSQLLVYHFMFGPGWKEGCSGCSFLADHIDGANLHLAHHDVSLVAVSRAPLAEFMPFKKRMGWSFKWVSSHGSGFNEDHHVSFTADDPAAGDSTYNYAPRTSPGEAELPGLSAFVKDGARQVFHTYSTYARGLDILIGAHNYLDLTPMGRNESSVMDWVRHHDRYGA